MTKKRPKRARRVLEKPGLLERIDLARRWLPEDEEDWKYFDDAEHARKTWERWGDVLRDEDEFGLLFGEGPGWLRGIKRSDLTIRPADEQACVICDDPATYAVMCRDDLIGAVCADCMGHGLGRFEERAAERAQERPELAETLEFLEEVLSEGITREEREKIEAYREAVTAWLSRRNKEGHSDD